MKDEPLSLEVEIVEKTTIPNSLGVTLRRANMLQTVPASGPMNSAAEVGDVGNRAGFFEFLKPTLGNLFLLGCLLGLFVLYCCSCVIHALTFPARKKSS